MAPSTLTDGPSTPRPAGQDFALDVGLLLRLTQDAVIVREPATGIIRYWGHGAEALYGWTSQEALGQVSHTLLGTVFPQPLPEIETQLGRTGSWEGDVVQVTRDGTRVVVASRWSVLGAASGPPMAYVEINSDVTERRRVEAALHASDRRLGRLQAATAAFARALTVEDVARITVEHAASALGAQAGTLVLLADDHAYLEMVALEGYGQSGLARWRRFPLEAPVPLAHSVRTGLPVWLRSHDELAELFPMYARGRVKGRFEALACAPLRHGDETLGALALSFAEPQEFPAEDRALVLAVAQQCALALERAQLLAREQAARVAAERERALFRGILRAATGYSVIATDPTGVITVFNAGAERMLGYRADEVVGKLTPLAIHEPEEVAARAAELGVPPGFDVFAAAASRHGWDTREWTYIRKDGSRLEVVLTLAALRDRARGSMGFIGIAHDVTARKMVEVERARLLIAEHEARTEAEEAVLMRDRVLAAIAHDLKNPLTAILGGAQVLTIGAARIKSEDAEKLARAADLVRRSATRMARWIAELSDAARLQIGEPLHLDRQPIDLLDVARDVLAENQSLARRRQIELTATVSTLVGEWDRVRLERVLDNLISNAVKYSPEESAVIVEVDSDGASTAVVRVRDQGIGIPAADLPYVFEPFRRASNVVSQMPGTGLGLSAARAIVEQHGGTIEIESQEGEGTVVTVRLPLAPTDDGPPAE